MDNKLLIISDDLGLDTLVNDGIIYALKNGLVGGASLMPNGREFNDAVKKLNDVENINIGIHFVLVEENPLVIKDLPKNHKIFFIKYIFGLINLENIEKELRAQLDKCLKAGIKPSFINSHQHLHLLPKITDIVIKLAKENDIKYIRTVVEPFSLKAGLFRGVESLFLGLLSKLAKNKIRKAELKTNNIFIGFLNAGNLQEEDIDLARDLSKRYSNKTIELGCHLGYENEELRKKYKNWGDYNWQKELDLIKNKK